LGGTNVHTYLRCSSADTYQLPFTWSGKIKTTKNYGPNAKFVPDGRTVWYDPKLVFHPQYGTDATSAAGNDENVMIGLDNGHTSVSAELRAERPEKPYGVRTGYQSKEVVHPGVVFDAEWHDFRIEVLSHSHYQLWWDGRLMADGLPSIVRSSSGAARPPLSNERWMTGHYTGNNIDYTGKSAAEVTRQIQRVFKDSKPFEYNYVIGQNDDDQIIEFAGKFQAAHSGGENGQSFGVLFLLGVGEEITDLMIDKWRWLRDVLIADGSLDPNVEQLQHRQMPGAATACPGKSIIRRWPELLLPYHNAPPTATPADPEEDDMQPTIIITDTKLVGVFANVAGRWIPWLGPIPAGVPTWSGDHPWTRAQILDDQGPYGADLWRDRQKTLGL
jgi:hypothetical protein